jgi:hypothetical protein
LGFFHSLSCQIEKFNKNNADEMWAVIQQSYNAVDHNKLDILWKTKSAMLKAIIEHEGAFVDIPHSRIRSEHVVVA